MSNQRIWAPLCDGDLAAGMRTAVLDIASELRAITFDDPSLTGAGAAGILYSYLAQAFPDGDFAPEVEPPLNTAIDLVERTPLPLWLYSGLCGFAWSLEHAYPAALEANDDDPNLEIDNVLYNALSQSPWPGDYDLMRGLVGLGVYALERAPREGAIRCMHRIIDRLAEKAEEREDGITWWTSPQFMGAGAKFHPDGVHTLGVAHGVPGAIGMLGRACLLPEVARRARPLLEGAVAWLLRQRLPPSSPSSFAYVAEGASKPARSAWCYGDPGIAATLLLASRAIGNEAWERVAIEIGIQAASRPPETAGVVDAGVCHGSAGLAHLFNRMYQATGLAPFAEAARFWFQWTLEFRQPGKGIGGFLPYKGETEPQLATGFLNGGSGIALALLGGITPIEPNWDRVLLCSIPPQNASGG